MPTERITTAPRMIAAECARVGIATCTICGAALLLDPGDDFDVIEKHAEWHAATPTPSNKESQS